MDVKQLQKSALEEIKRSQDVKTLEEIRIRYVGRKGGELTGILRSLKDLPLVERRKTGAAANALRQEIETALRKQLEKLKAKTYSPAGGLKPGFDVTLPGKKAPMGHLHPLTLMENRIKEIFLSLNFSVVEGPEVQTEHYNFDALNTPANHPARDMWDTFWIKSKGSPSAGGQKSKLLMRTHTSPMQIRYME